MVVVVAAGGSIGLDSMQFRSALRCSGFIFYLRLFICSSHPPHAQTHSRGVNEQIDIADNDQLVVLNVKNYTDCCSYDCWSLTLAVAAAITCGMNCTVSCTLSSDHTAETIVWSHFSLAYTHKHAREYATHKWTCPCTWVRHFDWNEMNSPNQQRYIHTQTRAITR